MINIKKIIDKIANTYPVILNLTNHVTMSFMADAQLAIGASPIMSLDIEDSTELLHIAHAININIGTLNPLFIQQAGAIAHLNGRNKPLILDPVGAGASNIRTQTAMTLSKHASVIRGNASEILALQGFIGKTKGVDTSIDMDQSLIEKTSKFSQETNKIIAVSGAIDIVASGTNIYKCRFGNPIMTRIAGMGCVLSSIIAVFCAVEEDLESATVAAILFYALCGELTYQKNPSLGVFQNNFIDILNNPDLDYIQEKINTLFSGRQQ